MPKRRNIHNIRILRINDHASNGVRVAQPDELPRLPRICRLVHAVPHNNVSADARLTSPDINNVRIRWRNRDRSNGRRRLRELVPEWLPVQSTVSRLPHASGNRAEIVRIRLARYSSNCQHTPPTERTDLPILHPFKRRLRRLRFRRSNHTRLRRKFFFRWLACRGWSNARLRRLIRLAALRKRHGANQQNSNEIAGAFQGSSSRHEMERSKCTLRGKALYTRFFWSVLRRAQNSDPNGADLTGSGKLTRISRTGKGTALSRAARKRVYARL